MYERERQFFDAIDKQRKESKLFAIFEFLLCWSILSMLIIPPLFIFYWDGWKDGLLMTGVVVLWWFIVISISFLF